MRSIKENGQKIKVRMKSEKREVSSEKIAIIRLLVYIIPFVKLISFYIKDWCCSYLIPFTQIYYSLIKSFHFYLFSYMPRLIFFQKYRIPDHLSLYILYYTFQKRWGGMLLNTDYCLQTTFTREGINV